MNQNLRADGTSKKVPAHYKGAPKDADGNAERIDDRPTPRDLFESFHAEFDFRIDACASRHNSKLPAYFDEDVDGLRQPWHRWRRVWCNPPYGAAIPFWLQKAIIERDLGCLSVVLLPASSSTKWFDDLVFGQCQVRYIQSKIKFVGQKNPAPFHSMALVYGPRIEPGFFYMRKRVIKWPNKTRVRCWSTFDINRKQIFDPAAIPGGWYDWNYQMTQQHRIIYFGCLGDLGHYFYLDPVKTWEKKLWLEGDPDFQDAGFSFDGLYINGYTGRPDVSEGLREGQVLWRYIEQTDTTIIAWPDFSVDKRGGSNSGFIARGNLAPDDFLFEAEQRWPDVFKRQRCDLEVFDMETYRTLREAWEKNSHSIRIKRELADPKSQLSKRLASVPKARARQ